METKFNFNSAICTSLKQSRKLLALGLKKETADIVYKPHYVNNILKDYYRPKILDKTVLEYMLTDDSFKDYIPAWSLHRLIEMIPTHIYQGEHEFYRTIKPHSILYMPVDMESMWSIGRVVVNTNNYYDGIIEMYEWLIKEGYFNKEYLV